MPLTQRQMECFKSNGQFLTEVAAALQQIAAAMLAESLVVENSETVTPTEKTFAAIRGRIAQQILAEQGVTNIVQTNNAPYPTAVNATSGSVAMKYLVQQMLMSPAWVMTPDDWADNELTARATIAAAMGMLLNQMTAIPNLN